MPGAPGSNQATFDGISHAISVLSEKAIDLTVGAYAKVYGFIEPEQGGRNCPIRQECTLFLTSEWAVLRNSGDRDAASVAD